MLQSYYVQTYIAKKAAKYLSNELNTEIGIGSLKVNLFLNIVLEDVFINDKHNNTIVNSKIIKIDINHLGIRKNIFDIQEVYLKESIINLVRYKDEDDWNYAFIADYFSETDTTSKKESKPLKLNVRGINIINSEFIYKNENKLIDDTSYINYDDIELKKLNLKANNLKINNDTISGKINNLSFIEKSGLNLSKLNGKLKLSNGFIDLSDFLLQTSNTILKGDLNFSANSFSSFNYFIDSVLIRSNLKNSVISFKDLSFFAPDIAGMSAKLQFNGSLKGKISNFKAKNLNIKYGNSTSFLGNITMVGLPDFNETFINANVEKLTSNSTDIKSFSLPLVNGKPSFIEIPGEIEKLGNIKIIGIFTGFVNNFVAKAQFFTDLGSVKTDLNLKKTNTKEKFSYNGDLQTIAFNLGALTPPSSKLQKASIKFNISGSGLSSSNIKAKLNGVIDSIEFNNYCYKNINISGDMAEKKFNGDLFIDDPYINLDFKGLVDYSDSLPYFNFKAKLNNTYLSKLNLVQRDSTPIISANLDFRFKGDNIDNFYGDIQIKDLSYFEGNKNYNINSIKLYVEKEINNIKNLKLISDIADANISGNFKFGDLPASLDKFLDDYLPSYALSTKENKEYNIPPENFSYNIILKDVNSLCDMFIPNLKISPNTSIKGTYNSVNSNLEISSTADEVIFSKRKFTNVIINGKTENKIINLNLNLSDLFITNNIIAENVVVVCEAKNDSILFGFKWDNSHLKGRNSGNIEGYSMFKNSSVIEAGFYNSTIIIQDTLWNIIAGNTIIIDTTSININNLQIDNKKQNFSINGKISENKYDKLNVKFTEFNISNLDSLFISYGIDADGVMEGTVDLLDIYNTINFYSDLKIKNFAFNNDYLGTMALKSSWDYLKQGIMIDADIIYKGNIGENIPLAVNGYFYPNKKDNNYDIDIDINNFKLNAISDYLSGIASNFRGKASGKFRLEGKTSTPELKGYLNLYHVGIHIDYIGTDYSLMGKIFATPTSFSFDSLIVYDNNIINQFKGSKAECSGVVTHNNFNDFQFDINIKPEKFTVLNTNSSQNELFYGQAFASGNMNIKGTPDNILMDIYAKTERGTRIILPFSGSSEISENDFIYFIKRDSSENQITEKLFENESGIELKINLEATPEAEVKIEFDPKIGDVITARGNGNLLMNVTTSGDFSMFGEYTISEGDYLFTFENVINKHFKIAKGGIISWNGDPFEANTSLRAIYDKPRAPLYDLVMHIDSSSKYRQKIPVNCILGLRGSLFNPDISFGIQLPGADESTKEIFNSVIDTTDEQEMIRQVFSLMVMNRFLPKQNTYDNPLGTGVGNTSFEMLSSQLSNWLSQISNNFDVGFNYRPGDELNSDQVEVALKTQFLNDRLIIDGNLGMAGNNNHNNTQASNIIGDVNLEYKLTDDGRFRVKAFSKANNAELLDNSAPYTQGVGIFYRKEFDSFYNLFRLKSKIK